MAKIEYTQNILTIAWIYMDALHIYNLSISISFLFNNLKSATNRGS